MAPRDPNNPLDLDRRRRQFQQVNPDPISSIPGYVDPATQPRRSLARTIGEQAQGAVDTVLGPLAFAAAGAAGANPSSSDLSGTSQTVAPPIPQRVNLIEPQLPQTSEGDLRQPGTGLTRIVKTGDGTYVQTNDPNVRGQARYYDALGNRADVNTAQIIADNPNLSGTRQLAQLEDGAPSQLASVEGRRAVLQRGRDSLARVGRMQAEASNAADQAFLDSLAPGDRAKLLTEQQKEAGLDRRAAAQLGVQQQGQQAALIQARNSVANTAFNQDLKERERLAENPQAGLQELFGSMANLTNDQKIAALSNPNDPRSARARAAFQTFAQQQGLGENFTPAQVTRASGLRRFLHSPLTLGLTAPAYDANNNALLDTQFDASDLGLTDEQLNALIAADAQVRSRSR